MEFISVQICLAETDSKLLNKSYIYSVNWRRAAISFSVSLRLLMGYGYLTLVRKYSQRIQTCSKRFNRLKCKQKQLHNGLLKLICTS